MAAPALTQRPENDPPDPGERRRRGLLDAADEILDQVERMRLDDQAAVPASLGEAIAALQRRLGRPAPPVAPDTLEGAHDLVLSVQGRLMASNPRNPSPRAHANRAAGQPVVTGIRGGGRWKVLVLPAPLPGFEGEWPELVEATVERALDRWAYARHHANAAARERRPAGPGLSAAAAAWKNYWELRVEADRLLRRGGRS